MKSLFLSCIGESHKASDKLCQDYSYAESMPSLSMAIVSDGHGGERYFRSDRGSRMAVNITRQAIHAFVENMAENILKDADKDSVFSGCGFESYKEGQEDTPSAHKALMWLLSSIISQWNAAITQDALNCDLTDWEQEHVEQQYKDEFLAKRNDETATFEKTYGCTLMAYVQTQTYWFAFQIGDGKCVFINRKDSAIVCEQPIPWDDRCFLNKTTSLCDAEALDRFRYCYQADGHFPIAVFLGSDGLDDSFGDGEHLHNFYIKVYKQIAKSGEDVTLDMLRRTLPEVSRTRSQDDMSVACVYDNQQLRENFYLLALYQETLCKEEIAKLNERISQLESKVASFGANLSQSEAINKQYAEKDLQRADTQRKQLNAKVRAIREEVEAYNRGQQKKTNVNSSKRKNTLFELITKRK